MLKMKRVKWKGPYVKGQLLKKFQDSEKAYKKNIRIVSRESIILPKFVGANVQIHNGKTFVLITIIDEMIGHKFGEFAPTRKQYSYKKLKNNKK